VGATGLNRSVFSIPKMDCAAEEQLVRSALDDLEGVRRLSFDLARRTLAVWHEGDPTPISAKLAPLALGAALSESRPAPGDSASAIGGPDTDATESRTLWVLLAINAVMFVVEIVAGWLAESTGLLADSLDMLADATVYGIGLYAVGRSVSLKKRAARLTGWLQVVLAVGVLQEVVRRLVSGSEPEAPLMLGIALLALAANVVCLLLIARNRHYGVHMMAVFICSANDVIANAGVILAAGLVAWTGSNVPDLVIGTVIGVVVLAGGARILRLR
jgi:Co/Zn/Cd efflux system component